MYGSLVNLHRTGTPFKPGIGSGSGGGDNTASESSTGEVGGSSGSSSLTEVMLTGEA